MTVTVTYTATETPRPGATGTQSDPGHIITIHDSRGMPVANFTGPTREACLQGLRDLGYTVNE